MKQVASLEKLQKIVTPALVGVAVAVGTIVGFVQIRQRAARRKRWFVPICVVAGLVLAGLVGGIVERVIDSEPRLECLNGTYVNTDGTMTCRAVFATSIPSGAVARCTDGTYSFNHSVATLCSRHGGIAVTL